MSVCLEKINLRNTKHRRSIESNRYFEEEYCSECYFGEYFAGG